MAEDHLLWEFDGYSWKKMVPEDPENDANPGANHLQRPTAVFDKKNNQESLYSAIVCLTVAFINSFVLGR